MKKTVFAFFFLIICFHCKAQIDLQCQGRDMHSIYISTAAGEIYRVDSVDTSPTIPVLVNSNGPGIFGISINPILDSLSSPLTMYCVDNLCNYHYWNGINWTNTGHTSGGNAAVNPGGTNDFIFNFDGGTATIYRYDGTSNGTLLVTGLTSPSIYDVATDNQGNFYLFYTNTLQIIAYHPSGIPVDTFSVTGIAPLGGGGFAILGDRLYLVTSNQLYEGIKSGNNINFAYIKTLPINPGDIATCPDAGFPLIDFNEVASSEITIGPNPAYDVLNIKINNNELSEFVLYDMASRIIIRQNFINSVSLNTDQFARGLYMYEVKSKTRILKNGKVVIH